MRIFTAIAILIFSQIGCASYRTRVITVIDSESGEPAANQTIDFSNMVPFPFFPPIENLSATLDSSGTARLRMPVLFGRLTLDDSFMALLSSEDIAKGFVSRHLYERPFPYSMSDEVVQSGSYTASKWSATLSKPALIRLGR